MTVKLGGSAGSVSLAQKLAKGDDGGYYFPSVDENSNLSWVASEEGMPIPSTVNIKGPKGDKGDIGVYIGEAEPSDNSILVWLNTDADAAQGLATEEYVDNAIANLDIPEAEVDLSEYYTRTETDEYFATIGYVDDALEGFYTKEEIDAMIPASGEEVSY